MMANENAENHKYLNDNQHTLQDTILLLNKHE